MSGFFFCARARLSPGSNKLGSLLSKSAAAVKGGKLIAGGHNNWSQHAHSLQPAPGTPSSCRGLRQADSHTGWAARDAFPTPQSIFNVSRFYQYKTVEYEARGSGQRGVGGPGSVAVLRCELRQVPPCLRFPVLICSAGLVTLELLVHGKKRGFTLTGWARSGVSHMSLH